MPQADLDARLLNPEQAEGAAGALREGKRSLSASSGQAEAGGEPKSLRERVMAARHALNLKEQAKQKLEAKLLAPAKQGTSKLLQQAWLNLIDSFGLTLIWINIHVFLRWVLGDKLFCKLGEEWLPKQVTAVGGGAAESGGKMIGIVEVMALLILDLIVLMVILAILGIIVMIVDFMQASLLDKIKLFIGGLTNISWAGIKALYSLFKSAL